MPKRANPFLIASELTVLLLGCLLILLALSRTVGVPGIPSVTIILGVVLVYWALRAWMRREPAEARLQTHIRAGSLTLVGLLMIAMPLAPLRYANLLVLTAGVVLVLRGLAAASLSLRAH